MNDKPKSTFLQKYILHPITALFFAYASGAFIYYFKLIDYQYAWLFAGTFIFISYMLLSIKYEMLLSAIFFSLSLVVFYKSLEIEPQKPQIVAFEQVARQKMTIIASLVQQFYIDKKKYPKNLNEIGYDLSFLSQNPLEYCVSKDCEKIDKLQEISNNSFVVWTQSKTQRFAMTNTFEFYKFKL